MSKSGANKKSKGVHVKHEYDQFKKLTYSNSTGRVACHDPKKSKQNPLKLKCQWLSMERRVWDDGKTKNFVQLRLEDQTEELARHAGIQFNADNTSVLSDNSLKGRETKETKVGRKKHKVWIGESTESLCPITDEELKTICDADSTNIRIIRGYYKGNKFYLDVPDKQARDVVTFLKCYYRECIDSDAYPEVADIKPPRKPIPKWMIIVGIILIMALIGQFL